MHVTKVSNTWNWLTKHQISVISFFLFSWRNCGLLIRNPLNMFFFFSLANCRTKVSWWSTSTLSRVIFPWGMRRETRTQGREIRRHIRGKSYKIRKVELEISLMGIHIEAEDSVTRSKLLLFVSYYLVNFIIEFLC